ncbi:MAG: DegT/DnrJ/EryC1/StrS family aminotransferase [candidate division Zixibacteria bacterium]|nr:DegT/DnrJ/EryC1/StrS family aminotransferase [candidate division Zixibacteria bacterium]
MFNTLPPAGIPFGWRFVFSAAADKHGEFSRAIEDMLGGKTSLTMSGKAALYLILRAMHRLRPERNEVIIPDYTCWTVPAVVVRADLRVKAADISLVNYGLSPKAVARVVSDKTLAVVATHLFGIPSNIDSIEDTCRDQGLFLIDDSAQALGASLNGRLMGSYGDAALLSFGRGKCITTVHGGAAVIHNESVQSQVEDVLEREFQPADSSPLRDMLELGVYKAFFSRHLFWLPDNLPFLGLGETVYDTSFLLSRMTEARAGRGTEIITNLKSINDIRNSKAQTYMELLGDNQDLTLPAKADFTSAACLRFPLLMPDREAATKAGELGHHLGISRMYPGTVSTIPALCANLADGSPGNVNATMVAERLITLPTHHGVDSNDMERIADLLNMIIANNRSSRVTEK